CPPRACRRSSWVEMVRRQGARAPRASWSAVPQVTGGHDAHQQFAERLEVLLDSIVIDLHGQERSRATQLPELLVQLRQRDTRADDTEHAEATRFAPATPAHGSRAAPRAGPSAAASRRGAPPARDGAADQPGCRASSTRAAAPLASVPASAT